MEDYQKAGIQFDQLEVARTIGQPLDPRKPVPKIVNAVCNTEIANAEDHTFYFDALLETDKVLVITANGEVVQENVTIDTPVQLTFIDLASPEYYIKLTEWATRKEDVLARKNKTINRALNSYETYKVITLLDAAATTAGNTNTLRSGVTRYQFTDLIIQLQQVQQYGDKYVMPIGADIWKDIVLWDFDDNKFHSPLESLKALDVELVRISLGSGAAQFNLGTGPSGGSGGTTAATDILAATTSYLVATDTEMGKPLLWVRKNLDQVKTLGGVIAEDGDEIQRVIFASPNPVTVTGTTRYLAIAMTGWEQIAAAVVNANGISEFVRS